MATQISLRPIFTFSLSDLSDKHLSWCEGKYSAVPWLRGNWVFWSRYNDELRYHHERRLLLDSNNGDPTMKEKIRCALQGFGPDWFYGPHLIQFWGLVNIGDSMYLTTCDQPFALMHNPEKDMEKDMEGLCRYRKHCLEYLIALDETSVREGELGPPGRVFRSGLPESIFDVSLYSSQEYPQRDKCLKYYLALPVYQSPGHICVGVLEIVSTEFDGFDAWDECADSLEKAGLTTIDRICSEDYLEPNSCHGEELHKINNALKEVCEACQIPVAETWIEANFEEQLLTIFEDSRHGQCDKWFRNTNRSCFIRKGHGVVGKAFSSQSACFCRDIRQLSITEYARIPSARQYKFSSCFAICLQSSCSDSCIYTLEFFLPTNETNSEDPRTLLRKIMEILEKHLQSSFKVASGQELGQNLVVQVIKVSSNDKLDTFEVTNLKHNGNEVTNLKKRGSAYTLQSELGITREVLEQYSALKVEDAAKSLGISRSTLKRKCRRHGIHRWSPHKARKCNQAVDQQEFAKLSKKNIETHSMSGATRLQDDSSIMVKATYRDDVIKFQLSLSARKMDLDEKVAMRLNLQVGSFKIKYQDEEDDWVLIPCDEDLSTSLNRLRSVGKTTIKMLVCR